MRKGARWYLVGLKLCSLFYLGSVLTNFNLQRPAVLLSNSTHFRHRVSKVRGEGSVNVGLQLEKQVTQRSRKSLILK